MGAGCEGGFGFWAQEVREGWGSGPGRDGVLLQFAIDGNIHAADAVWPDSRENAEVLLAQGVDSSKITIQPLAVALRVCCLLCRSCVVMVVSIRVDIGRMNVVSVSGTECRQRAGFFP